ncbi:Tyrosine-protein kinase wzc [compost metagenome]
MERLEVSVRGKNATVFRLQLEDAVPVRGTDLLNALIEEYNKSAIEEKNREASKALAFIDDRLKLITGELSTVEQDVQAYKTSKEITDISTQSAQLLQQMKENDSQLNQVNIQLGTLESVSDFIQSGGRNSPPNVFTADPVLQNKLNKLNDLELERTKLLSTTGESNPLVEGVNEQIANTKSSILYSIQDIKTGLSTTKNTLERNNSQYSSAIRAVPQKERSLINIERQKNIKQDLYLYLLQKREETALSYAAMVIDSQVVDPPQSSTIPVRPSKTKALAIAMLLGGLIPIGSIWGRKILNNKILNKQLIEDATNAPILGVIGKNHSKEVMVVKEGSRTAISEQFRFLRTNLQYIDQGKNYKTILVTSSISNEGKSFISLNLGSSISITGKKTVILEMDFRKPDIGNKINANKRLGLSDYLNGLVTIDEIIVPVENQPNLYLLPCGAIPVNPAELLLSDKLDELFKEVSALFDQVIIDSPPIGLVTDALLLEKYAQASIYVVRYGYTLVPHLKMISDLHSKGKFKNMSIVFNAVDLEASEEYMYNDHGYYTHNHVNKKLNKRLKLN